MTDHGSARLFLVRCDIRPGSSDEMAELRPAHRDHLGRHAANILLGGVVGDEPHDPEAICFVISSPDAESAAAVALGDPYAKVYDSVDVEQFHQRIPSGG